MSFNVHSVTERFPNRRIDWHASVPSTMTLAAALAREGCDSGTVVMADEQTAGIGRQGHSWHSESEAGLYVSSVLRLPIDTAQLPVLMLALGLATHDAIEQVTGLAVDLRWPNDVMIGNKKTAGIIAQLEDAAVITGIGINVNHRHFPEEIAALATSLYIASGFHVSREDLLVALLRSVDACCQILIDDGPPAILRMFTRASSYAVGRRVRVEQDGAMIEGVTCGLNPSGFLTVREDNGRESTILAGGVRPV